jgi:hypothetical protein
MSSFFNQAKIINVYYNKGDRKPYDVNGKPIAYIGEESIGSTEATTLRFYLGENIDSSTAIIVTKRADGERRIDICLKVENGVDSYYQVTLNSWYSQVKGKATLVFKVYNGDVEFDSEEMPTEIVSVEGRIVVSDIFNLEIAYAPDSDFVVPPDDVPEYAQWFLALSQKLDKVDSVTVDIALPEPLEDNNYNNRYFFIQNEGVGKLFYIDGNEPIEVVWGVGTIQLTPSGNGDVVTGLEAGKLYWSEDKGTIVGGLYDDQVVGIGDGFFWFVKAKVGEANITKGDVVQFAGNVGGQIVVKKADFAEITAQPDLLMGVAKHNIIAGNKGYIVAIGRLDNINTSGFSTPILYLSTTTPGQLTSTKPTNGFKGSIAAIGRASTEGGSNGFLLVRPNFIKGINEATDVLITSLTNKDILRWNSTSGRWENNADLTDLETNLQDYKDDIADGTIIVGKAENDKDGLEFDATYLKKTTASSTYLTQANASSTYLTQANATAIYIPLSQKSIPNGVATLGVDGRVLPSQLPGSIGEVLEYPTLLDFPEVGAAEKIFIAVDTNKTYRWSGTQYVEISQSLALGETTETAFAGSRGVALETLTDNIVDGTQGLTDTRITNSATTIQPLIVNGIADTSTNLQEWQLNGSVVASLTGGGDFRTSFLSAISGNNNGRISFTSTGALISRNIADANNALRVNLANSSATGNIANFQFAGANKLEVTKDGFLNQDGVRLFHQPVNNSNTFFGNESGGTNTTGTSNSGFGRRSFLALTTGSNNVGVGVSSLRLTTTGSGNVAVGLSAGNTNTTGNTNTFIGNAAGFNDSQLATATNSTALGNGSYTDASNQMVFGNASVTQFKFDRNTGAIALLPQTTISSANFPPLLTERTSTGTNNPLTASSLRAKTSNDMVDGFGSVFLFEITDNANVNNAIASFGASRSGADNSGRLIFRTFNTGTETEKMTILPDGKVGIGTSSPATQLDITAGDISPLRATRTSTQTDTVRFLGTNRHKTSGDMVDGFGSRFSLAIEDNANVENVIGAISAIRSGADNSGRFAIETSNAGTLSEKVSVLPTGLVGINETSPSAQLQVKSGATDRVGLIIDTISGFNQALNLEEFRVNTSVVARINGFGSFATGGSIFNLVNINNANITPASTGTTISRNIADANPALIVNQANAGSTGDILRLQKAGSSLGVFTHEGRLGIGNTNPDQKLTITTSSGSNYTKTTNGTTTVFSGVESSNLGLFGTTSNHATIFITNDSERMRITSGGEVYIAGTTDQGAYNLQVNGTGVWGAGAYVDGSDIRIKKEVKGLQDGLSVIEKLKPVTYLYEEKYSKDPNRQVGFIAQDLMEVLKEKDYMKGIVRQGKQIYSVAYQEIIPLLTKAVQELSAELKAIKSKLNMPDRPVEHVEYVPPVAEPLVKTNNQVIQTNNATTQPMSQVVQENFEPITNFEYDENE